jgi:hypothetical protein
VRATAGQAKSAHFRHVRDAWPDTKFTDILVRKDGGPKTSREFLRVAAARGVPHARCGMVVRVAAQWGVLVGHNDSANFDVLFTTGSKRWTDRQRSPWRYQVVSAEYFICSVKHTKRKDRYIVFWRPENAGYAFPLSWSGRYSEELVLSNFSYYNGGDSSIAIRCDVVERLAVPPAPRMIDNDAGPVVLNNHENWAVLIEGVTHEPLRPVVPEFRGSRKKQFRSSKWTRQA